MIKVLQMSFHVLSSCLVLTPGSQIWRGLLGAGKTERTIQHTSRLKGSLRVDWP